jgi:hypothetical protein
MRMDVRDALVLEFLRVAPWRGAQQRGVAAGAEPRLAATPGR